MTTQKQNLSQIYLRPDSSPLYLLRQKRMYVWRQSSFSTYITNFGLEWLRRGCGGSAQGWGEYFASSQEGSLAGMAKFWKAPNNRYLPLSTELFENFNNLYGHTPVHNGWVSALDTLFISSTTIYYIGNVPPWINAKPTNSAIIRYYTDLQNPISW